MSAHGVRDPKVIAEALREAVARIETLWLEGCEAGMHLELNWRPATQEETTEQQLPSGMLKFQVVTRVNV